MNTISKAFERLNRPQIRRDMIHDIGDSARFVILGALIVCAVIGGLYV